MRYAIISDIHANSSALKHVLDDAATNDVQSIVCLGDVVGYGPMPDSAITMLRKAHTTVIAGNHDDAVSGRMSSDAFNELAADAVRRHREALSSDDREWLGRLEYVYRMEGAIATHGDFTDPSAFNYIDDEESAIANFRHTDADLMFVGHTHTPEIFITGNSGKVYQIPAQDFSIEDGKRYIVNPGSVGYPRETDGKCFSSYVIYDSFARTVCFRFIPFSVASVMQRGFTPSSRQRTILVSAIIFLIMTCVLAYALYDRHSPSAVVPTSQPENIESVSQMTLERKSLTIPFAHRYVKANLKLKPLSPPVLLKIEFKNSNGKSLTPISIVVKGRNSRSFKVPDGAISAVFTLARCTPEENPAIVEFLPVSSLDSGRKHKSEH